jgi:hypothetical protein
MTLLSSIQDAQSFLVRPFVVKQLLIRTPLALVEQFNPNHYFLWMFDPNTTTYGDTSDYVYLRLFPEYESADVPTGEKGYAPSFSGTVIRNSTTRQKFRAAVKQQQYFIFQIIDMLAKIANTSNPHTPIKVIDFCRPDFEPVSYSDGYASIRYGRIDIEQPPAVVRALYGDYTKNPWLFSFEDYRLTLG